VRRDRDNDLPGAHAERNVISLLRNRDSFHDNGCMSTRVLGRMRERHEMNVEIDIM
jgi:hypothetical protein